LENGTATEYTYNNLNQLTEETTGDKTITYANKALEALENGDTRGLNDHALHGNRSGQRAIDIKGTGKGRGGGRMIYKYGENGEINIIEILLNHKY